VKGAPHRRLLSYALSACALLPPTVSAAQQAAPALPSPGPLPLTPNTDQGGGPAGDPLNPQNLLQFMYQVKTAPGTDANGAPDTVTTDTWRLRGDLSVNLDAQWQLVLRGDLPYLAKDAASDSNPNGAFLYGLGDVDAQAALIHEIDARWKAGGGVRIIAPTGDDALGSGKWQVMPVAGVRYALPEISVGSYFEPLARWDYSFAGDPAKKNINNLQFAPMVNFTLPDRWFLTLYPSTDIRWNFGGPVTGQTGRLFLPFDARIGHKFSDYFNISLEVGAPIIKDYPVYDFMTAVRLNLTF
jgi:hypothetical protein